MRTSDPEISNDGILAGVFFLWLMIVLLTPDSINAEYINKGQAKCVTNGGMKSFDHNYIADHIATCNNGAEFKLDTSIERASYGNDTGSKG